MRGKVWIPRPRIFASRRVVPAPLGAPQAAARFASRGRVWIPRPKITASRLVVGAPLGSPQAKAVFPRQGIKRGPTKPLTSRLVLAAAAVPAPPSTRAALGIKRGPTKNRPSRLVVAAPLGAPQAKGVQVRTHVWARRPQLVGSRLISPAPAIATAPMAATLALRGVRRPTGKPPRPRFVVAPPASPQAAGTRISGVRRVPSKGGRPRIFVGLAPAVAAPPTIAHGARWARVRALRSRRISPAPLGGPQAPARQATAGVRRVHPRRPPQARLFVAPFVAAAVALQDYVDSVRGVISAISTGAVSSASSNFGTNSADSRRGPSSPDSTESGSSIDTEVQGR